MAHLDIARHCRKVVGFLTRNEIVAILLGRGPEHLDRREYYALLLTMLQICTVAIVMGSVMYYHLRTGTE